MHVTARGHRHREHVATTSLALILLLQLASTPPDTMARLVVGEVTVVAAPRHAALATALAEAAQQPREWTGLGRVDPGPLVLVVAGNRQEMMRITRGRVPPWGVGYAIPSQGFIALRIDAGDPYGTLRHELAHVVLHRRIRSRVPAWFTEGYAVVAAGEYGRMDALQLNIAVVSGRVPDLRGVDGALRGGNEAEAGTAYALAASAVQELARRNPTRTLEPLLARLSAGASFDAAVEATTGLTPDRFDEVWHRGVRRRYNWGIWLATGGVWVLVAGSLGFAAAWRRRLDRPRRAALDIGWPAPPPDAGEHDNQITVAGEPLDRPDTHH